MHPDVASPALPDSFALSEGELIALQVRSALALGLSDTHLQDSVRDGAPVPALVVIPAGQLSATVGSHPVVQ